MNSSVPSALRALRTQQIFLILEMDSPLGGLIHLNDGPLIDAAARLGK